METWDGHFDIFDAKTAATSRSCIHQASLVHSFLKNRLAFFMIREPDNSPSLSIVFRLGPSTAIWLTVFGVFAYNSYAEKLPTEQ